VLLGVCVDHRSSFEPLERIEYSQRNRFRTLYPLMLFHDRINGTLRDSFQLVTSPVRASLAG
jgi:hypothetical protein